MLVKDTCNVCSDAIGGCTVANDTRWAGAYGVNVDFVARTHCSVEIVSYEDIHVCLQPSRFLG